MSISALQSLGLNKTESDIYELLLKIGEAPAQEIIANINLKRPTVYKGLYTLVRKGLVEKNDIKKKLHFRPKSPALLLEHAESRYHEASQARSMLQTIMPMLLSSYTQAVERPVVQTFEGVDGLKKIYMDTINEEKDVFAVLQTAEVEPEIYEWLTHSYAKLRAKHKIHAKVIVASGKWSSEYQKDDVESFRTTIQVPSTTFPFQHELNIYGDKVAFINYKKGEALIGILIKHPQIATTMKAFFDLAWLGAGKVSPTTS